MSSRKITIALLFCCISTLLIAQKKTYQIKADTVRIFNSCDTAELVLENRTRGIINGVLTNKGNGVTEFRKVFTKLNDSLYLIGGDTLRATGKNIYNSDGVVTSNRILNLDSHDIKFQNVASFLITSKQRPLVVSRTAMDSSTFHILNHQQTYGNGTNLTIPTPWTALAVRGQGCDATIAMISDTVGTCNQGQSIDFTVLRPRRDAWLTSMDPNIANNRGFNKHLLGRIQLQTTNNLANSTQLMFAVKSDTGFFADGAYNFFFSPGGANGHVPFPVMTVNGAYKHPNGYHVKMPFVRVNGGLFVGYSRNWYFNSRNANDIITGVDDVAGHVQGFWDTRFSVYADSLPLKIFKLPTIRGSAFLTYSPTRTVDGNNVAFEYKDSVYEDIRNYISVKGLSTPSDFNLKENISLSQFDTDKLLDISIKDFSYKTDENKTLYTGLIAQELKSVMPELVLGKEGNYSIDYVKMVPYLLKAIQEQRQLILQQQQTITKIEEQQAESGKSLPADVLLLLQQLQQQLVQQQEEIIKLKDELKKD